MPIKPRKRFGQNFLTDQNIQRKIIQAAELKTRDIVLEIGAGRGEITRLITGQVLQVIALEIDPLLSGILKTNLNNAKNVKIINRDILKYKLENRIKKIKVIGNIPYYISTPIIEFILKNRKKITAAYITVQREFAQRITARPGSKEYGALSCFVQYYACPKIIFFIKRSCFYPQPGVDSCLLKLELRRKPAVRAKNEKLFFRITRAAFNKRRKILKNSLFGIIPSVKLEEFFRKYSIDSNIRPECLGLEDFAKLSNLCSW